jgi:hypothetical protein
MQPMMTWCKKLTLPMTQTKWKKVVEHRAKEMISLLKKLIKTLMSYRMHMFALACPMIIDINIRMLMSI